MTRARRTQTGKAEAEPGSQVTRAEPLTVASLAVQARLVPVAEDREQAFAALLVRYQNVCREWDRLVQQAVDLLGPDIPSDRSSSGPSVFKHEE
ncbi:hypothetical protein [Microvirga soli]|uniref:hypothetical protein n=1 Tax=Microvirga soli TaxID=1854496 RepID=UPI00191F0BC9|nr:hypothetical protein [Microvirga soli]